MSDDNHKVDTMLFEYGNYFETERDALKVLEENRKTLMHCYGVLRDFEWAMGKMRKGLRVRRSTFRPGLHIMLIDSQLYYPRAEIMGTASKNAENHCIGKEIEKWP